MHSFHALVCQASYCMTCFGKLWEEWKTVDSRYVCVCSDIYTVLYRYTNPKPENYRFLEQHLMGMLLTGVSSSSTSHPRILSTKLKIHLHRRNDFCSQILSTCWKPFEIAGSRSIVLLRYVTCSLSFICNHSCCCITQQNNGKSISWSHLTELYHRNTSPGMGIRIVPKLKFEHISLTLFSKMLVDLAAQVRILWLPPMLSYQILIFMCITRRGTWNCSLCGDGGQVLWCPECAQLYTRGTLQKVVSNALYLKQRHASEGICIVN